jgi:hypothetical protein
MAAEDAQITAELARKMTPEQKLRVVERLWRTARALKAAGLRAQHPEWSEPQLARAVRDAFLFRHG